MRTSSEKLLIFKIVSKGIVSRSFENNQGSFAEGAVVYKKLNCIGTFRQYLTENFGFCNLDKYYN